MNVDIEIEANARSTEDSVILNSGYRLNRSFIDPTLITMTTDTALKYEVESAVVFACDGTLTAMDQPFIENLFKLYVEKYFNDRKGLIFVAKGF